jgi:hypothetical protein
MFLPVMFLLCLLLLSTLTFLMFCSPRSPAVACLPAVADVPAVFSIQTAVGASVVTKAPLLLTVFLFLLFPAVSAIVDVSSVAGVFSVFSIHAVVGILLLPGSCCC